MRVVDTEKEHIFVFFDLRVPAIFLLKRRKNLPAISATSY